MNDLMVVGQRWNVTLPGYFAGNLAVLNFGSLMVEKWASLVLLPSGVDRYGLPLFWVGIIAFWKRSDLLNDFLPERERKRKKRRKRVMMRLEEIGRKIWKKKSVIPDLSGQNCCIK
jgi:hypothetical protein